MIARIRGLTLNLSLALLSIVVLLLAVKCADTILGLVQPVPARSPEVDSLIFYPGTASEFDMHDYKTVERINALGIRDEEVGLESKRQFRVVAVGDSFTYGWGVNLEDTWVKHLQKNLRERGLDVEVLNLGRPAAGPAEYVTLVQRATERLDPDLIIIGLLTADDLRQVVPTVILRGVIAAQRYLPNFSRRYLRENPVAKQDMRGMIPIRPAEETREYYARMAVATLEEMSESARARFDNLPEDVRKAFHAGRLNPWMIGHSTGHPDYFMYVLDETEISRRVQDLAYLLDHIKGYAAEADVPLMMIGIPEGFLVNEPAYENVQRIGFEVVPAMKTTTLLDEALTRMAQEKELPYYPLTDAFRDHNEDPELYLALDRHMTGQGNKLIADTIAPVVAGQLAGQDSD
jgi:lysophospholipase L1-like esterase